MNEVRQCKKDRMNEREKSDYETDNKRQQGKRGDNKNERDQSNQEIENEKKGRRARKGEGTGKINEEIRGTRATRRQRMKRMSESKERGETGRMTGRNERDQSYQETENEKE